MNSAPVFSVVQDLHFRSADCVDPKFGEAFADVGREIKEAKREGKELTSGGLSQQKAVGEHGPDDGGENGVF